MKKFSENFRPSLRDIRQLNAIVSYHDPNGFYILSTEDDDNLLTENDFEIATESGVIDYDKETINSVNPLFNANLFKTTCKSVQIDCKNEISKNTNVEVRIGVYKENENKYEYLNYGNYIIQDITYQADSDSYLMTGYDKMIESMVSYDDNPLSITFPIKHKDFVIAICNKLGWKYDLINYPNYNKNIVKDFYKGQNLTYRDVLDDLNGVCGGSFMFNLKNKLIWKQPTETNEIVEDDDLKDTNVDFAEKYGKVNALTITTNGNVVLDNREDTQSITENGKTEFNINDNYILSYSTEDFIDEIFNEVNGLEYYLYDIDSTGLLIFEPLDIFTFRHNGVDYKTIMFNDDIKLTQGLVETTYAERPEETEKDYVTTDKDKNKLNNALISIDKANAEIKLNTNAINTANSKIVLKANAQGKIVQVKLESDASAGSTFTIDADQIDLNATDVLNILSGNTINLTSKNIAIDSTNFKVDKDGNMTANAGTFGGTVNTSKDLTVGNNAYIGKNQSSSGVDNKYLYFSTNTYLNRLRIGNSERLGLFSNFIMAGAPLSVSYNNGTWFNSSSDYFQLKTTGVTISGGTDSIYMSHQPSIGSDKRLKQNIKNIDVSWIDNLKLKEFEYKKTPDKKQIGLIAQDYVGEEYSKYFLNQDDKGYYSIEYQTITNALIQYCQELKQEVNLLKEEIKSLKESDK